MNPILILLISVVSLILSAIVMANTSSLQKNSDVNVADKATKAYNAGTGLLVFSLAGLLVGYMMVQNRRKEGKSLY